MSLVGEIKSGGSQEPQLKEEDAKQILDNLGINYNKEDLKNDPNIKAIQELWEKKKALKRLVLI